MGGACGSGKTVDGDNLPKKCKGPAVESVVFYIQTNQIDKIVAYFEADKDKID